MQSISPAPIVSNSGPLLVILPGLGAVATTFIAGVELARRGAGAPIGSLTQLGSLPDALGVQTPMNTALPLAQLDDLAFAAWDIHGEDAATVAKRSEVLHGAHLAAVEPFLSRLRPMPGVHHPEVLQNLEPVDICRLQHRREQAEALREDVRRAQKQAHADRAVTVFLTSTERKQRETAAHQSLAAFEKALDRNDATITPTQLYAYASLKEGVPFANGTPNNSVNLPALHELALEMCLPVAGRDLKTGQTLMKTVIGPGLRARLLGVAGWFSTNILGNRDGAVLDDQEAFRSKEATKKGVLDSIFQKEEHPELYSSLSHVVNINYYPPRGDQKEGWDNIDLFGWMGYPMQMKVNFLCRDSILAAPLVLDIALLLDLAHRSGMSGMQEWMSFFFKAPMSQPGLDPVHDLFEQQRMLNTVLSGLAARHAQQRREPLVAEARTTVRTGTAAARG